MASRPPSLEHAWWAGPHRAAPGTSVDHELQSGDPSKIAEVREARLQCCPRLDRELHERYDAGSLAGNKARRAFAAVRAARASRATFTALSTAIASRALLTRETRLA